jgi:hypothetical protein
MGHFSMEKSLNPGSVLGENQHTGDSGQTLKDVAALNGTDASEISRLLPLAFLSPKMVEKILNGMQPVEMTALKLSRAELPYLWTSQATILGR